MIVNQETSIMGISENISNSIGACLQTGFVSEANTMNISQVEDKNNGFSKYFFDENMTSNPIRECINKD